MLITNPHSIMLTKMRKNTSGFTLIETLITTVVLTLVAVGVTSFLISIQYTAQDSLYESTAFTVASSTLEQMKSEDAADLENAMNDGTFNLITSLDTNIPLTLGASNVLPIPIVTNADNPQTMELTMTPSIAALVGGNGYRLRIEYAYDHPRDNRTRTKVISSIRARFSTLPL